jgi:hypothetical protein
MPPVVLSTGAGAGDNSGPFLYTLFTPIVHALYSESHCGGGGSCLAAGCGCSCSEGNGVPGFFGPAPCLAFQGLTVPGGGSSSRSPLILVLIHKCFLNYICPTSPVNP